MADSPASRTTKPSSGIPVPKVKRQSVVSGSTNGQSTPSTGSRPASPVILAPPPASRPSQAIRRQSLLNATERKASFGEMKTDDPAHLKAQIALLQSSLAASHQRILALTSDLNLESSSTPSTPLNGASNLFDGSTADAYQSGDEESSQVPLPGPSVISRLPHSTSSYDLRSSAVTPGKTADTRKVSDGPLGLGRIPQSAVTQALVLHATPTRSPSGATDSLTVPSPTPSPQDGSHLRSPFLGSEPPVSPSFQSDGRQSPLRKVSGAASAASTRVIDGLQTDLINARGHNEKLKQEMRSNQRLIGSMTRQNEDLKETKERMRVECEGLNNVIARKERLLQEVLERARTAESSLAQHLSTKKSLEQSTKKALQEMTAQVADAQAAQMKAEREANSLRDGVRSLRDVWAREVKGVKDAMKRSEEKSKADIAAARDTHLRLVELVEAQAAERSNIQRLAQDSMTHSAETDSLFAADIANLKAQLVTSNDDAANAKARASELATELIRLRRLMREPRRASLEDATRLSDDA